MSVPSTGCVWSGCLSLMPRLLENPASRLAGGRLEATFLLSAYSLQLLSFAFQGRGNLFPSQPKGVGLLSARTIIGVYGQVSGIAAF